MVIVLALLVGGVWPAAAVPAPRPLCAISDERLTEVSGLVSDGAHWYAVNDGGSRLEVYVLGRDCAVRRVITAPVDPFDVEDLARAPDGTLWLADTGDNRLQRDTVALHALTPGGSATLYRLTYPDGPHDAEALLLDRTGVPYVITKNILGESEVYRPVGRLDSPGPTPLKKVAELSLAGTDTPGGPVGRIGSVLVTGGAVSADGTVVALRTYTDAYLYPAPDGDVVAALKREPVRVPLPGEDQGEAIALEPDGTLLSVSEGLRQPVRAVTGATALIERSSAKTTSASQRDVTSAAKSGDRPADSAGLTDLPGPVQGALVGAVAGGLAGLGYYAVAKFRRRDR